MEEVKEEIKWKLEQQEISDFLPLCCDAKENALRSDTSQKFFQGIDEDIKVKQEYEFCKSPMDVDIKLLLKNEENVKTCKEENFEDNKNELFTKELIKIIKEESIAGENKNDIKTFDDFQVEHDSNDFLESEFEDIDPECREVPSAAQDHLKRSEQVSNPSRKPSSNTKKKYVKALKFICTYCKKRFPQSDILRRHIRIHTGEKPYQCRFCLKLFRTKALLKVHTPIHTGKLYKCTLCSKRFARREGLKLHMLSHENTRPFVCTVCPKAFYTKATLQRHINNLHYKGEKDIQRTSVSKNENSNVKDGIKNELSDNFICSDCGKVYRSKYSLVEHIKLHTKKNKKNKFECKVCGKFVFSRNYLLAHMRLHTNEYPFTCAECNVSFKSKIHLQSHFDHTHTSLRNYICHECKASFKSSSNLMTHFQVQHNNDKTPKFFCEICKRGFCRVTYLNRHIKIHTDADKTFICDMCGQRCRSKTDIKRHIDTHMDCVEKSHACHLCDKSFNKPSHLVRHMRIHSDHQPFQCTLCPKAYKDPHSLKSHIASYHSDTKYICDDCGFCSVNDHYFKRHVRFGNCQEFKFVCKLCEGNIRFKNKTRLKKHMEKSHGKNM